VKLETPEGEITDPAEEEKEPVETNPGEDPSVETKPPATPQGAPVTVPQQENAAPSVPEGAVLRKPKFRTLLDGRRRAVA
jgi:hypothetical protein